ncbi:MAG: hypothetical protein K2X47_12910 [Bdellovibrionales bacterium]|nr:hypothetical protein [Bdellovibrionales bacterium]
MKKTDFQLLKPIFFVAVALAICGIGFFWKATSVHRHNAQREDALASLASDTLIDQALASFKTSEKTSPESLEASAKVLGGDSIPRPSEKIQVLESILSQANDNDPRMDTILRNFSSAEKQELMLKYSQLEPELLNQRGTLVFLLGREIKDTSDAQFIEDVLQSEPCRSLGRCSEELKGRDRGSHEGEIGTEMTLIYPQMVALHSVETTLRKPDTTAEVRQRLQKTLETSSRSQHPVIANRASEILQRTSRQ